MIILYSGFDGLDLALKLNISDEFDTLLAELKTDAAEIDGPVGGDWKGVPFTVQPTGARGGYAYRLDTGPDGEIWFLKRPNKNDPWGARLSAKSAALLCHGLPGWRARVERLAGLFSGVSEPVGVSISRVDVAVDILDPDFVPDDDYFVMHSRTGKKTIGELIETNGVSGRVTSITVGKMPGRQTILYDKREEVMAKSKREWPVIWNKALERRGLPHLNMADPSVSRVWRIETRAGKDHLANRWHVRTWADLSHVLPLMLQAAMEDIRYCAPTADSNRARWPTHPMWAGALTEMVSCVERSIPVLEPADYRLITREERCAVIERQMLGLAVSYAVLHGRPKSEFEDFLRMVPDRLLSISLRHPTSLATRMQRAADRFNGLG
ncbi:hypothetical protein [Jannaschia sp. M317]|uniref:hypothetical protein n=1 Tax=Jannaschia sp. M317 TaxID=2867011 RepID=UPI0021A3A1F9|nr:hypothetical protein [Jannaschia sp. M317]UWQ19282.1 hypothetical protein K3551_08445 [Jannaschia sp. M317]